MINLTQRTSNEINKEIATRVVALRKRKKISQADLANKSGVSFGSVKRFEQTGEISLSSLTKIAIALNAESGLDSLFADVEFSSIEEILNGQN